MKSSRAYIAGVGTSGILIGSFLLLLMVGSAIVAFRGAPGEASNDGLDQLDVTHRGQASGADRSPRRSAGWDPARRDRAGRGERGRDQGRDATRRVRGEQSSRGGASDLVSGAADGGSAAAGESVVGTGGHSGGGGSLPRLSGQAPPQGGTQSAPSVGGVAEDVGGAVEQTGGALGETVGEAAPPLPGPVTGPGETAGGAVEQAAPVKDETVSGVADTVDAATEDVTGATGELPGTTLP